MKNVKNGFYAQIASETDRHRLKTCCSSSVACTENFHGGCLVQGHMVVIWCALFVTSQFDVIFMFPNQRFGEVC